MNTKTIIAIVVAAIIIIAGIVLLASKQPAATQPSSGGKVLHVVAAENFWGSLLQQLGGSHVQVLSIVSDPNADPHEYESNADNARAVAQADYVVENGAGYDEWMDKLLSAGGLPDRKVLNVATLLGKKDGDNPHFWYNPAYVNTVIAKMEKDLIALDPQDTAYYQSQYAALQASLKPYQDRVASIKQQFSGTPVGATESIFVYPAQALGLDLVSPPAFMDAIDEGNDPPTQSVVQFQNLINQKKIDVLLYNEQTVTPITETMKKLAADQDIPIVGITETIQPPDASFQDWMNSELIAIENALNQKALGQ